MRVLARPEVDGPVNEVEVEILELELGEGVIEGGLDVGRVVLRVPELGGDEDVLALEARDICKGALDTLGDLLLVLVSGWWKICQLAFFHSVAGFGHGHSSLRRSSANPPPRGSRPRHLQQFLDSRDFANGAKDGGIEGFCAWGLFTYIFARSCAEF